MVTYGELEASLHEYSLPFVQGTHRKPRHEYPSLLGESQTCFGGCLTLRERQREREGEGEGGRGRDGGQRERESIYSHHKLATTLTGVCPVQFVEVAHLEEKQVVGELLLDSLKLSHETRTPRESRVTSSPSCCRSGYGQLCSWDFAVCAKWCFTDDAGSIPPSSSRCRQPWQRLQTPEKAGNRERGV